MKNNIKRHKLLKELFKLRNQKKPPTPTSEIGLTFKEIDEFLKTTQPQRKLVLSELFNSKDVDLFKKDKEKGCFITDIGIGSLSSKKYKRNNENIILNWFKNFTQIFIPIASLIITIIVLSINPKNNYDKLNIELQTIKKKIKHIEIIQNKKELNLKTQNSKN